MAEPIAAAHASWPLGVVLAACGIGALAATTGSVHVAPSAGILIAAAIAVTVLLLRDQRTTAIAGAIVAGLAAAHVLLRPGMPQVHDPDHVWGLWAYARAVHAGHVLPMWISDLGAGMPLLRFYGPVSFLLVLPGVAAGFAPVGLWKEAMLQASVLSALAMLFGARLLGAGWRASLVAACALAFAPWRLTVENLRGALGESTALIAAPLVAAGALAMVRAGSRRAAWTLAVATAVLIPTHLITLFCLGIVLVPALIAQELGDRGDGTLPKRFGVALAPAVLAAALTAVWWLPAFAESKFTSLPIQTERHGYFIYDQHGLTVGDLVARRAWDTQRSSLKLSDRSAGMEGKQMPFYAGIVLFGAALTAPWWSRSRRTWAPAAGAGAALLFSTAPAAAVMTHLPGFHKIQFPWRFLTAGSIFAALAIGVGLAAWEWSSWKRMAPVLAIPALLVFDAAPYTGACGWVAPYRGLTHWVRVEGAAVDAPFDVAMRAAPQPIPTAPTRVGGLYLPPADLTTPISLFWVCYVEWLTPQVYNGFLHARGPRDFADGAVSAYYLEKREQPAMVSAQPYATLNDVDAGAATIEPGRITLRPSVPDGGARLVVREQMFPGWIANVDGRDVKIDTTQLGFMELSLPSGSHDVVLSFTQRTAPRIAGWLITALALLGTVPFFFQTPRGRPKRARFFFKSARAGRASARESPRTSVPRGI